MIKLRYAALGPHRGPQTPRQQRQVNDLNYATLVLCLGINRRAMPSAVVRCSVVTTSAAIGSAVQVQPLRCLFCGGQVTGRGEHVLPQWLLGRYDRRGPSPFTYEVNGVPQAKRDGTVRTTTEMARALLRPVCGSADPGNCNGWLEHTFEGPAQGSVAVLLTGTGSVQNAEVLAVAQWVVKTLLLAAHPAVEHPGVRVPPRPWQSFPAAWLPHLKATGLFPADLSLWLAVHDPQANGGHLGLAMK